MRSADEYSVGGEGEGGTEEIVGRAVARCKGVELAPRAASAKEDIDLALRGVAIDGRDVGRNDRFVVVQRESVAEVKERSRIARGQFLHLAPGAAAIGEDVSRAGACVAVDGCPEGADERVIAADRD